MEETTTSKSRNLDRFTNEVTPLRFVSVPKRRLTKMLATIAEEEKDSGDDGIVKGLQACSTPMCGQETCCLSRQLESSMLLFLVQMAETN
ncbi:hypothetical protein V6N13_049970 [Hibiscus sabdariffa]|uniref:Uncharacterized protein n=1 Tax=Hibiscus sabdariffa TaxID=183260 RepID=A0ABR2QVJ2_9ROSI